MLIHSKLPFSTVNGPGVRVVVWVQGCSIGCHGCWNSATHAFAGAQISPDEVADWILSCQGVEGVTFSGGEPLQQGPELLRLCGLLHTRAPHFSIGMFSGYTLKELLAGHWRWRDPASSEWRQGSFELFADIIKHLDFAVLGRFVVGKATTEKPLCGSLNQQVVFFSDRYSLAQLGPQAYEIFISEDGSRVTTTGFPPQFVNITSQI